MNEPSLFELLLHPYDMATWLCWIVLLLCAGWFRRWRGIVLGELTVATTVFMLRLRWRNDAMTQFEWRGKPMFDANFFVVVIWSALLVMVILFPAGLIGLLLGFRKGQGVESKPPPLPPADS